jgi:hypothetical protein
VLNLDDTIAVTQNFCSKQNFTRVWRETRTGRKKMAVKWLRCLRESHPDLAELAERLNAQDGFVMPFDKKIAENADHDGAHGAGGDSSERGRKHKKEGKGERKSGRSKSTQRSSSSPSAPPLASVVAEKNSDGRKKHVSALDEPACLGPVSGSAEGASAVVYSGDSETKSVGDSLEADGDNEKRQKRKIDVVAGALAEMMAPSSEPENPATDSKSAAPLCAMRDCR